MLELYRLTLFAGFIAQKKNPQAVNVGSKHDETEIYMQPHNIASLYHISLFQLIVCKASILYNRTGYKRAMPQSPAAAIV